MASRGLNHTIQLAPSTVLAVACELSHLESSEIFHVRAESHAKSGDALYLLHWVWSSSHQKRVEEPYDLPMQSFPGSVAIRETMLGAQRRTFVALLGGPDVAQA